MEVDELSPLSQLFNVADINGVLRAAGMDGAALHSDTISAFYHRPWVGQATLDEVILQAIQHRIDVVPLLKMVEFAGEIDLSPRYSGT